MTSLPMTDAVAQRIGVGTLLVAPATSLPADWQLDPDPVVRGWLRVVNTFSELQHDSDLARDGWTFFFRAGAVKTRSFGWSATGNMSKAISQLTAEARSQHCNCLQIDSVTERSLLGVPSTRMVAHVRHIQTGHVFAGN